MKHQTSTRRGGATATSLLLALCLVWAAMPWASAQTDQPETVFIVTTIDDNDDSMCDAAHCSLREAINAANANGGLDVINFNIAGGGVKSIIPSAVLPTITGAVTIDGLTQPGATCAAWPPTLLVELKGTSTVGNGINLAGGSSIVRGLVINGWTSHGIRIDSTDNKVECSFVGTNVSGTAALPNSMSGVLINSGSVNTIGGLSSQKRNVISGNGLFGVRIWGPSGNNLVQGNYIGADAAGTTAIPNGNGGLNLTDGTTLNTVGGNNVAARNLISGNSGPGVYIQALGTTNNSIVNNFIGVSASGAAALGNTLSGVNIEGAPGNAIVSNVISGNGQGGLVIGSGGADNNSIIGNWIGTASNGSGPIPNDAYGIRVYTGGDGNQIGGANPGNGNVVAFNDGDGVIVINGAGNAIRGNSIHSNSVLGIDLDWNGVTPNDPLDPDTGGNLRQNYPTLTSASVAGGVSVAGDINTTPNTGITIEVFGNAACDGSGNGEGQTFIGSLSTTTAANGNASFSTVFPIAPGGFWLTATATDPAGNTSEFSPCRALNCYLDFNSNGRVDVQDIMQVAARWNNPGAYNATYDVAPPFGSPIDIFDLIAVAEQWNALCPTFEG